MRRKVMQKLIEWKRQGEKRMPLILHGARQVGKKLILLTSLGVRITRT